MTGLPKKMLRRGQLEHCSSSCDRYIASMARLLLTALLLFAVAQKSHGFYYPKYNGPSSLAEERAAMDAKMAVFFREEALRLGESLPFRFPAAVTAPLGRLPRHVADAIPFSSAALPDVLPELAVAEGSTQAAKMEETLGMCEAPGLSWEGKFCATSLEALVEGVQGVLGTTDVRQMVSKNVPRAGSPLQTYAVTAVRPVRGSVFVGCHQKEYPYAVYMCHSTGPARAYQVEMEGADGSRVTLVSVCHIDTSEWDKDHVAFKFLGTKPGGPPVCHVMPYGHIMWAAKKDAGLSIVDA